jgi:protoporphyrinogen/coproporphyrinogen III oxidase
MSARFTHVVVGGGISGLGAAHFAARRGVETLVLEGSDRVGGTLNSHRFGACPGFWTEAGGHTCYNSYGNLLGILDDLGLTPLIVPKERVPYRLWRGGQRRSLLSVIHPFELAVSIPRLLLASREGKGLAEYYGAGFGHRNYRDLFGPAFQAVVCQAADDFPAELLFRKKPRRAGLPKSFTLPGGLSEIAQAIAGQEGVQVRLRQRVVGVAQADTGFRVGLAGGGEIACDRLTLAAGPDSAAELLPPGMEAAATLAGDIGVAEIETLVLAVRRADLTDRSLPPLAGLISADDGFYSAVSRDYRPDPVWRGFAFHFRPGVLDRDAQLARACRALGVDADRVAEVAHVANRLPALRKGHAERVRRLDQALAGTPLAITGNWFIGVSIEDCLTRSRHEVDRLFPVAGGQPPAQREDTTHAAR